MRTKVFRLGITVLVGTVVGSVLLAAGVASSATGEALLVSTRADRSDAVPLQGADLSGSVYVFLADPPADPAVIGVDFYIDSAPPADPTRVENTAPYDLRGGSAEKPTAWKLDAVPSGGHSVTAVVRTAAGSTTVTATFTVRAGSTPTTAPPTVTPPSTTAPPTVTPPSSTPMSSSPTLPGPGAPQLLVSTSATRSGATALAGSTRSGNVYVFVSPPASPAVSGVDFYIDAAPPATPARTENTAPYDLQGGSVTTANAWNLGTVTPGAHTVAAVIRTATSSTTTTATFTVGTGPAPTTTPPTTTPPTTVDDPLVRASWQGDSATTLTFTWRTGDPQTPAEVRLRPAGTAIWQSATGTAKPAGGLGHQRSATATGLLPGTAYEYQVRVDDGWSATATAGTTSPTMPLSFVYFADTGITGRLDGLSTGTAAVIDAMAAQRPDLLLGGGDYAYYNTDPRWPTLDGAIDAWLTQMQPVMSNAVFMPTYGNHEVLLGEGFDAWADRFATPTGVGGKSSTVDTRGTFSFDAGPVHFVSIMAVDETSGLPSANRTWIADDIRAAQARGMRWVVPYLHGIPLGDGTNHKTNYALQSQLGPLFESLGVPLVLFSHDQSFERTYPLTGLRDTRATAPTRTSTSLSCYTDADGVIWVKTSPAGKLSSKNGDFSQFLSVAQPPWTAVRDNTAFHFTEVNATATSLSVTVHGVTPGQPATVVDSFVIQGGNC